MHDAVCIFSCYFFAYYFCAVEIVFSDTTNLVSNDATGCTSLLAGMTDDSYRLQYIEIVPFTRGTDGPCTSECDSGDLSAEVKQEHLPVVKQEPDDVCCIGL